MKTKGITIWELHAERIVLGLAAALLVLFTAMQFTGEPNAVPKPQGTGVIAPDEIDALLQAEAERLLERLDEASPPQIELPDPVPALDYLLARFDRPVYPQPALPQFHVAVAPDIRGFERGRGVEFPVPQVKAPYQVVVKSYSDALADGVLSEHVDLQQQFPDPSQPLDITFVTAAARFSVADLRRQFRGEHIDLDAEEKAAIPASWYKDRPENIVDVVIERQQLVDAHWTNITTLDPIPGQFTFRPQLGEGIGAAVRDQVIEQLGDPIVQLDIIRPEFYPTKNEGWSPPALDEPEIPEGLAPKDEEVLRIKSAIVRFKEKRKRLIERLEKLGGTIEGCDEGPAEPPKGGSGDGDGPSGGRGTPGRRGAPGSGGGMGPGGGPVRRDKGGGGYGSADKGDEAAIRRRCKEINRLEKIITAREEQLSRLSAPSEIDDGTSGEPDGQSTPPQDDEITIWGHDLTVEPSKTYRYRLTVKIYNPFFGKKRSLVEQQQDLAESFTLSSAVSEWSDPLHVSPPLRVFITKATPAGGRAAAGTLGLGRAIAEVYRFYDGDQWVETFRVQPGDYIGTVKEYRMPDGEEPVRIDFSTGLVVLDIVEDIDPGRGGGLEAGRAAKVLLQDLRTGEILQLRDPQVEILNPDRRRLKQRAKSGRA
ncbi:MAG: hypothetical protein IH830_11585 [Planctomycetes bacterium]|nr:hypothetical protein [Planctomycetota bacterium]